jgi:hypothetical protein
MNNRKKLRILRSIDAAEQVICNGKQLRDVAKEMEISHQRVRQLIDYACAYFDDKGKSVEQMRQEKKVWSDRFYEATVSEVLSWK